MKKFYYIKFCFFIVFCLVLSVGYSQETNNNTYLINQYFQAGLNIEEASENNSQTSSFQENQIQQNNIVVIQQIGENNQVGVVKNDLDSQNIQQNGNNNYYNYINYYNNTPLNLNVIQEGNSNSLQIYGQNSIINNMSIVQKSNFKTVVIKNF